MHKASLVLALLAAGLAFGETAELRRGGFTLTCTSCPSCPMRARFAPDGKHAFLNTSKVAEKDRAALSERLFGLMEKAACGKYSRALRPIAPDDVNLPVAQAMTNDLDVLQFNRLMQESTNDYEKATALFGLRCLLSFPLLSGSETRNLPEMTRELVSNPFLIAMSQHNLGLPVQIVRQDGKSHVLVKDADESGGKSRFLAFWNLKNTPSAFSLPFAKIDLGGEVQIMELGERADLGIYSGSFTTSLPPHSARFYRLDAEQRLVDAESQKPKGALRQEKLPECSLTVTPLRGESQISKSGTSRLVQSGSSLGSNTGTKTITRNLKWRIETRFRENRPEKLELTAYYLGNDERNKVVQLGAETKTLALDKNGRSSVEITSPTTRQTKSRTSSSSSRHAGGGGFRSTKTTIRGERVTGCVLRLYADGRLVKSWASDSRWANEAKKESFSVDNLNKNSGKIGLR